VILRPGADGDRGSGHLPDTAQALAGAGFATLRFYSKTPVGKQAVAVARSWSTAVRRYVSVVYWRATPLCGLTAREHKRREWRFCCTR